MRISEVAKTTGIPVSTIRFYEKRGVIPKPARNGQDRSFSEKDISTLQFVRDAQSVGLLLSDISNLVQGSWETAELQELVTKHRQDIQKQIETLQRIDGALLALDTCRCGNIAECELNGTLILHHD